MSVFVIFVRLCDISVLLLGIVMHSGFIWFGRYIFEVQGRSCPFCGYAMLPFCHSFVGSLKDFVDLYISQL